MECLAKPMSSSRSLVANESNEVATFHIFHTSPPFLTPVLLLSTSSLSLITLRKQEK